MLGGTKHSNGGLAVLPTGILRNAFAVVGAVDIHLAATIGAIEQASQRRGLAVTVRVASGISPNTLYVVKSFLVDNGLVSVLKNRPFALVNIMAFLVLEMLACLEVDSMAQVFPPFEDVHNSGGRPHIRVFDFLRFVQALAMPRHVDGGHLNFVSGQAAGNLKRPVTL